MPLLPSNWASFITMGTTTSKPSCGWPKCRKKTRRAVKRVSLSEWRNTTGDTWIALTWLSVRLAARVPLTEVYNNIGVVDARRGRRTEAVEYFSKAVAADPSDADYHFNLALALFKSGDNAGAARQLREELQLKPSDSEAKALLDLLNRGVTMASVTSASASGGPAASQPRIPIERIKRNYDEASYRQIEMQINNLKQQQRTK